ncbi:hypothetical protein E2K80_15650 [Rhodophyticola sp. CCM32]|uniref:hypothetical protein n=1 Tax=Rhodophyticola sp. CCM32 TaxID=2916397 RepID=UPI00107F685C|nr:hypothetical protein [Rhodophyticola sp. CCM32]QBY01984.1 hypothetical protein E2K80_15650 [Rhodophyticola sp. CCM32]
MTDASMLPIRAFVEANTTRFISTAYIDDPALNPLSDTADELSFLEAFEALTSSRRGCRNLSLPASPLMSF